MKIQLLLFFFLAFAYSGYTQISIDSSKLTTGTEANLLLDNLRGIITSDGNLFYIENDKETLTSYKNGVVVWQINVLKQFGKPYLGEPFIRYIGLSGNEITVVYGKHDFIRFDRKTGKVTGGGSG